jgi:hypothetical protein
MLILGALWIAVDAPEVAGMFAGVAAAAFSLVLTAWMFRFAVDSVKRLFAPLPPKVEPRRPAAEETPVRLAGRPLASLQHDQLEALARIEHQLRSTVVIPQTSPRERSAHPYRRRAPVEIPAAANRRRR